jgi:hypothetical protein
MDLLHSLPPTSVQNETSFNQMKLIKTDRRHRPSQEHLNDLMMIRLQSPSIMEFDPTTAINKWMEVGGSEWSKSINPSTLLRPFCLNP